MAVYDTYPAVDEDNNFNPLIMAKFLRLRGSIFAGDTIDKYFGADYQGIWQFSLSAGTEITGLPSGVRAGVVMVLPQLGGQLISSYGDSSGPEQMWYRGRNALTGTNPHGVWQNLSMLSTVKQVGIVPSTANIDYWYIPEQAGWWGISSTTTAQKIVGLPVPAPGKLLNLPGGISVQVYMSHAVTGYAAGFFFRTRAGLPDSVWSDWINLATAGSGGGDSSEYALKHAYRNDTSRRRLGYKIGAPCAVALQFDDYNAAFRDKVLPILREFDVPATMALAVNWVEGNVNHELAEAVPWDTVQGWVLNDGVEAQGHSWTHGNAQTAQSITKEIVESADYMESKMPSVVIDQWSMPGTGTDTPYGGYKGKTIEDFTETLAGKLLLSRYGFVGAARAGYFQPGGGSDYIGQSHGIGESSTVDEAKAAIESAIAGGYAVAMMHHPGWLDTSGYKTTAQLRQLIQWLAEQRNQGRLILTTRRALNVFDNTTNTRDNLLNGAFNNDARGWVGWTKNSAGNLSNASTTVCSKSIPLLPIGWARGGTREFHLIVRATAQSVIRLTIECGSLSSTKDYTIPANVWYDVRKFFTIPMAGGSDLTFKFQRVSGGTIEVQQANAYAA